MENIKFITRGNREKSNRARQVGGERRTGSKRREPDIGDRIVRASRRRRASQISLDHIAEHCVTLLARSPRQHGDKVDLVGLQAFQHLRVPCLMGSLRGPIRSARGGIAKPIQEMSRTLNDINQ